jgi:hypothetical protein
LKITPAPHDNHLKEDDVAMKEVKVENSAQNKEMQNAAKKRKLNSGLGS